MEPSVLEPGASNDAPGADMWIGIVSLFPEMFEAITRHGVTGRAVERGHIALEFWNRMRLLCLRMPEKRCKSFLKKM